MEKVLNPTVCFFDSGIGGLCLLYECVRKLPDVDFVYFADNENVPYGSLDKNTLIAKVDEIFLRIQNLNPSAVVVACNTVTANCIDYLRNKYKFDIIGIQHAVKPASKQGGKCLVLATPATSKSEALTELIKKFGNGNMEIFANENLASYIENHIDELNYSDIVKLLPQKRFDSVVLGCTHYIFIKDIVKSFYKCPVFDGIEGTADHLCEKLGKNDHRGKRAQKITFSGGFEYKNRGIFRKLISEKGISALNE